MKYYYHQKKENRHLCSQAFIPMKLQTIIIFVFLVSCLSGCVSATESLSDDVTVTPNFERIEPVDDGKEIIQTNTGNWLVDFQRKAYVAIIELFSGTVLQNIIIILIPVVTAFGGYLLFLRFASAKSRTPSPIPEKILSFLHEHNGSSQKQIVEAVSASRGSVSYHLKNLEQKGYLKVVRANGVTQYFLTSAASASAEHAAVLRFLSRKKSGTVLRLLFERKKIARKELSAVLHISETTARWYLEQFEQCGLVVSREGEGGVYYCITKETEDVFQNLIFELN